MLLFTIVLIFRWWWLAFWFRLSIFLIIFGSCGRGWCTVDIFGGHGNRGLLSWLINNRSKLITAATFVLLTLLFLLLFLRLFMLDRFSFLWSIDCQVMPRECNHCNVFKAHFAIFLYKLDCLLFTSGLMHSQNFCL